VSLGFEKAAVTNVDGDWSVAEQFNVALKQLANGRREQLQVEDQYARSKIASKVANYAEAIRYRTVALADGAAQNWNGGNALCAALCARAVVETVAQLAYVKNGVAVALKLEELSDIDRIVEQGTFATRTEDVLKESPELKAQRISTWIDKLDHEIPGVRRHYNYLSDMKIEGARGIRFKRCLANCCLVVTISRALYLDSICDGARHFAASPAL
jgi:hypothetical protein